MYDAPVLTSKFDIHYLIRNDVIFILSRIITSRNNIINISNIKKLKI